MRLSFVRGGVNRAPLQLEKMRPGRAGGQLQQRRLGRYVRSRILELPVSYGDRMAPERAGDVPPQYARLLIEPLQPFLEVGGEDVDPSAL